MLVFYMVLGVNCSDFCASGDNTEYYLYEMRRSRIESVDMSLVVRFCVFENLWHFKTNSESDVGGGAIKIYTEFPVCLETSHNVFRNCSTIDGYDGGALWARCPSGSVYMLGNCGHSCDAIYGAFATFLCNCSINVSACLLCGQNGNSRYHAISLCRSTYLINNLNSSHHSVYGTGAGLGVTRAIRLAVRFATFCYLESSNIVISNVGQANQGEYIEYCNFVHNKVIECLVKSSGAIFLSNCAFMNNNLINGMALATGVYNEITGKMTVTDCYFDKEVTFTGVGSINFYTVSTLPPGTHRIEHLSTHNCKAEFPTNSFTAVFRVESRRYTVYVWFMLYHTMTVS